MKLHSLPFRFKCRATSAVFFIQWNSRLVIDLRYHDTHVIAMDIAFSAADVWKVHYTTPRFLPGTTKCGFICKCWGDHVDQHDPPLLFNLAHDPSEAHPLDATLPKHKSIIEHVATEVQAFKASVLPVPNQFAYHRWVPRPWLQPYCKFPTFYCWVAVSCITGITPTSITRCRAKHGPLDRYVKSRVAHAPGITGTFSPPL